MSLKFKVYHECKMPSMLVSEREITWTTGTFWWKKTHTRTEKIYQDTGALFVCDDCKSEYEWVPGFKFSGEDNNEGDWRATSRTYTWKKA